LVYHGKGRKYHFLRDREGILFMERYIVPCHTAFFAKGEYRWAQQLKIYENIENVNTDHSWASALRKITLASAFRHSSSQSCTGKKKCRTAYP
jgi:hypothetical protein